MSLVQGGAAGGAPQGASAILAAAAPYYQPPAVPQDVQPDRPIGYGAFGVVCPMALPGSRNPDSFPGLNPKPKLNPMTMMMLPAFDSMRFSGI
ncbi:hypothetical protein ACLKA6_019202 [Drosophila palustris]